MTLAQQEYWELVEEIDELGVGLDCDEIEFIAGLIDDDRRGLLTVGQMNRTAAIHRRRVGIEEED